MNGDDRDSQDNHHRHASERDERAGKDCEASQQFNKNGCPGHKDRRRHADRVQDAREKLRASGEFGVSMRQEAVADDQTQRDRVQGLGKGRERARGMGV